MPQSYFTPHLPSPLVVLAFLGTGFFLVLALIAALAALALGRRRLAGRLSLASLAGGAGYLAVLLAVSLASREQVLRKGDRKYFCEMDCHLAYSIVAASAPDGGERLVTVKTWFDPSTIASFRGDAPLTPNPRMLYVVDDRGRRYKAGDTAALRRTLRPGESYATTFAFRVPAEAKGLRLFLGDPPGLENLIVNHENSPLHAKIYFELPPPASARMDGGS